MRESQLFASHFDLIPFSIYIVDIPTYTIIFSNKSFNERFGQHVNQICHKVLYERDAPCTDCYMCKLLTGAGLPNGETLIFEHFNEVDDRWYQMQERAMTWPDGRLVKYTIAVDISALKQTQNRLAEAHAELAIQRDALEKLSITDQLTKLANRRRIDDILSSEINRFNRYGHPFSLLLLDVDHFKVINDTFGHDVGDTVLQGIAKIIAEGVRQIDMPGRWGGEEFLIICPETDRPGALALAELLRSRIANCKFSEVGNRTVSIGVATVMSGESSKDILRRVDKSLYQAKEAGRNQVRA
jgi:diguanylate cyclase (GGDEF)-like protein